VALLVGRAEDIRPDLVPVPRIEPRRHDLTTLAVLAALPVLVFGLPAFLGHPVVPSDDLAQNYPLRVLVGQQLRSGHLPLYDPYIWSGAPLLGGWNAGAAYPFTLLFAVMSGSAAWTINLIVTWWVASLGTFAFLRASRLSPVASFLGSLSFSFAGAMAAQVSHFGLVAGMSWVPVALVALLRLSEAQEPRRRWAWTLALAGALGMLILAGEPRAIDDAVVVVALYALWRTWRLGRGSSRVSFVGCVLGGVALGVAIGAVQWLPGIDAVQTSQRAAHSAALFDSGSLAPKWLFLSIVPDLLGGSGSFGEPTFFANYSLAEITGYVGLMPLVAALALLGRVRLHRRLPEWGIWHAVALVGVLLTLGSNSALGSVLAHLPLFGDQRLQSRNIVIVDFALAVLLAYWADLWLRGAPPPPRRRPSASQLLGVIPGAVAVAVVSVTLAWGAGMLRWLDLTPGMADRAGPLKPWLVPFLVLGCLAVALVLWGGRLRRRWRTRALVGFVALDVGVFSVLALVSVAPGLTRSPAPAVPPSATSAPGSAPAPSPPVVPIHDLVAAGRFAVYDPDLLDYSELSELGVPDGNVLSGTPSIEGYSSLVESTYAQVTGSHQATGEGQNVLDPTAVADGTLDQLDTTVLLTPSAYLVTSAGQAPSLPDRRAGRRVLGPGDTATWYLGADLAATSVTVPVETAPARDEPRIQVGLVGPGGSTTWMSPVVAPGGVVSVPLTGAHDVVALRVRAGPKSVDLGPPTLATPDGETYRADGQLQGALVPPRWTFAGFDGAFAVFHNSWARPPLTLRSLLHGSTAGAHVVAKGGPPFEPTRASVSSPRGVTVVRAVAFIPGWTATWHPSGTSTARTLAVRSSGLVQAVTVPAGGGTIAWSYAPPGVQTGLWVSAGALVVSAGVGLVVLVSRRRAHQSGHRPRTGAGQIAHGRCRTRGSRQGASPFRPARGARLDRSSSR